MRGSAGDGHVVRLPRRPGGYGLAFGGTEEGVVPFAGVVAPVARQRGGHAVVRVCGEGVSFGFEGRRVG